MGYDWVSDHVSMKASDQELQCKKAHVWVALAPRHVSRVPRAEVQMGHVLCSQGDSAARDIRQAALDGIWGHR